MLVLFGQFQVAHAEMREQSWLQMGHALFDEVVEVRDGKVRIDLLEAVEDKSGLSGNRPFDKLLALLPQLSL